MTTITLYVKYDEDNYGNRYGATYSTEPTVDDDEIAEVSCAVWEQYRLAKLVYDPALSALETAVESGKYSLRAPGPFRQSPFVPIWSRVRGLTEF